ncbi:MAG: alpha/beta fold hydrolase [Ruminococcaceae bacterium]|nr:alpha/beta fold hydrolase [Oscillospiraceae bacterium]
MITKKVEKIFTSIVYARSEESPAVFLFSCKDFERLNQKSFDVESSLGHTLKGYFYYYDNPIKSKLVVFEHGMFGGHRSYMREIELLCKEGYLVYAYDHTGCMESGGDGTGGFSQSLRDSNEVISALKKIKELDGYDIYVVGHSWGGFATLNVPRFHPDIKKIVAISGFLSPKDIIYQHLGGPLRVFAKKIYKGEVEKNPDYMEISALDSLKSVETKALIIHSPNDHMVNYKKNFVRLQKALCGKENVEFLTVDDARHNPTYTLEAVKEKDVFFKKLKKANKKKQLSTREGAEAFRDQFDWYKITEQSSEVWGKIFEFLKK